MLFADTTPLHYVTAVIGQTRRILFLQCMPTNSATCHPPYIYVCCTFWNTDGFTQDPMNLSAEGPGPALAHELAPDVARVGCNKCCRFMTILPSRPLQAAPAMPLASTWLHCYCHCAASATGDWRYLGPVAELISCPAPMSEDPGFPSFLLVI